MKWNDVAAWLEPWLPYGAAALIGLRWAKAQTAAQRIWSFVCAFLMGVYLGPAIGEALSLGPRQTVGVGMLICWLGQDAIGGLMVVATKFREDPLTSFRDWWKAWRGQ